MATPVFGLGKRLKRFRKFRGWNQHDLSGRLGISQSNLSRLESDKQDLSASLLRKIVDLDEEWFGDLAGAAPKLPFGTIMVPVVARVAAGTWRPIGDTVVGEDPIPVYGLQNQFLNPQAVIVEGRSMDRVFRPGTRLITVSPHDFLKAGYRIASDLYIVAQQVNDEGQYETTVKQLEIQPDGAHWLWPRSTDPNHQQPIKIPASKDWPDPPFDLEQVPVGEVRIASIVVMEQQIVVPASAL